MILQKSISMKLFFLALSMMFSTGFTLINGFEKAKLPVSKQNPRINFIWDGSHPEFTDLDQFQEGQLSDLPHRSAMEEIINQSLDSWSTIEGSYLRLVLDKTDQDQQADNTDQVFSITSAEDLSLAAATASPIVTNGEIIDCDITISKKVTSAHFLIKSLVHELGHCAGLSHNQSSIQSVMSYSNIFSVFPSVSDKAAIIFLYPDDQTAELKHTISSGCAAVGADNNSHTATFNTDNHKKTTTTKQTHSHHQNPYKPLLFLAVVLFPLLVLLN